jgi:hypothetical protein
MSQYDGQIYTEAMVCDVNVGCLLKQVEVLANLIPLSKCKDSKRDQTMIAVRKYEEVGDMYLIL